MNVKRVGSVAGSTTFSTIIVAFFVSVKMHDTIPPGGTLKFVGENGGFNPVLSMHEADVRSQPRGMVVSDTV